MLRFGIIQQVDRMKGRVKVRFEEDDLVSDWIPFTIPQAKNNRFHYWPSDGEHVACHMDENCENGIVLGAVYSERDAVPSEFEGSQAAYKSDAVTIRINVDRVEIQVGDTMQSYDTDNVVIETSSNIKLVAPTIEIDGDLTVTGSISADGSLEVSGSIEADGEVKTNQLGGVSLSTHKHLGVQPGPGITGTPQPGS